jgi:hypothetical protein
MLSFMLTDVYAEGSKLTRYAECHYAECNYVESRGTPALGANRVHWKGLPGTNILAYFSPISVKKKKQFYVRGHLAKRMSISRPVKTSMMESN